MPTFKDYFGSDTPEEQTSQEQEPDFMTYTGGPKESFGLDDLSKDHNFNIIAAQMESRFGVTENTHERQDIVDKWVNYNRKFNMGNTLSVLNEASYLSKADDGQQVKALNSYTLWDNMKGAWDGGTVAQKADNVWDYGVALIADPINLVSFGAGKLAAGSATKIAASAAKEALTISANKIISKAGQSGVARSALKPAVKAEIGAARQRILQKALKGESFAGIREGATKTGIESMGKRELRTAIGTETVAAAGIDYIQQKAAYMKVGFQDEYNPMNTALIAGGGFFGYGLAKGMGLASGGALPTVMALDVFDAATAAEAAAKKLAQEQGVKLNKERLAELLASTTPESKAARDSLMKSVKTSAEAAAKWSAMKAAGRSTASNLKDSGITSSIDDVEGVNAFLNGVRGQDGFDGLASILDKAGINLAYEEDVWSGLVHFMSDTATKLPPNVKKEVQGLYENTIKTLDDGFKGVNSLDEAMPLMAAKFSYAGSLMNTAGQVGRVVAGVRKSKAALGDGRSITPEEALDGIVDPATGEYKNFVLKERGIIGTVQDNLIRVLVTHPGTTALNLLGWVHASGVQTATDVVRGTLYGGAAVGKGLMGDKVGAVEYAQKAGHMMDLQRQKMKNLMNPFATQQETLSFMAANPKLQKELFRYVSGGIDSKDVLKTLDLDFADLEKPGGFERIMDGFQTAYGVKAVDILTKTQEFMYNIDKQIRINYNMSYADFIGAKGPDGSPLHWNKMRSEDFLKIQTVAVDDTLRSVFSKSYGGGDFKADRNPVEGVAKLIEDARKYPIIGAMVPFGQFFNNTIAFMADHSGISAAHALAFKTGRDPMELLSKAAVGYTTAYIVSEYEMKNMEEGLAWYESRDSDGEVRSRLYDYPLSLWKGVGRITAHLRRDGEVPTELLDDVVRTFGTQSLTRSLGEANAELYDFVTELAQGKDFEAMNAFQTSMGKMASMYISGFSRPLDPINQIAAFAMGDAYNETDRNIGSKAVNNSVRYVESIFDGFDMATGLNTVDGLKSVGSAIGLDVDNEDLEKQRPLESGGRPSPIGRIFGYRSVPAPQATDKMFNDIGRPKWKTGIKATIPEANNTLNRVISKYIEEAASIVVYKDSWKTASLIVKKKMVSDALSLAKRKAMRELYKSANPTDKRHRLMIDISKRSNNVSYDEIKIALEEIGIDSPVEELNYEELKLLRNFLKLEKRETKREAAMIRQEAS